MVNDTKYWHLPVRPPEIRTARCPICGYLRIVTPQSLTCPIDHADNGYSVNLDQDSE